LQQTDTSSIAGIPLPQMPDRGALPAWSPGEVWPGGAIRSIDARHDDVGTGRARCWIRPQHPLLEGEEISSRSRMLGMVDFANGIATRVAPERALYPNVDRTASLFREPVGEWFALATSLSFGADGIGRTESVLSDGHGPVGTSAQTRPIRPRCPRASADARFALPGRVRRSHAPPRRADRGRRRPRSRPLRGRRRGAAAR